MKIRSSIHNRVLAALALMLIIAAFPGTAVYAAPTGGTNQGQAAQAVTLQAVRVDVWPEYDQPSVLVIYNLTLASTVSLPASLSVRIPASAAKPAAVAMQDVAGLYNLNYTVAAAGDWVEVRFTTPVPEVRVEYYDPLQKTGGTRNFTFRWPGDYAVENLTIKVQQPLGATGFTFRPDIGAGRADNDGLTYFTQVIGKVTAGTTFDLAMSYNKTSDALTNPQQFTPAEANQPVDANTPGRVKLFKGISMTRPQLILLGLGLLLIIGGVGWYYQTGARARMASGASSAGGRKRHVRAESAVEPVGGLHEGAFCHQCGKKAGPGDVFCRACGTRLR